MASCKPRPCVPSDACAVHPAHALHLAHPDGLALCLQSKGETGGPALVRALLDFLLADREDDWVVQITKGGCIGLGLGRVCLDVQIPRRLALGCLPSLVWAWAGCAWPSADPQAACSWIWAGCAWPSADPQAAGSRVPTLPARFTCRDPPCNAHPMPALLCRAGVGRQRLAARPRGARAAGAQPGAAAVAPTRDTAALGGASRGTAALFVWSSCAVIRCLRGSPVATGRWAV